MPTLHANNAGTLIGITAPDQTVTGAITTLTFDLVGNEDLLGDIQFNANSYILIPGPILRKNGVTVAVDSTPAATGIRRAIQILTEQEALIAAATTIPQIKAILEQDRVLMRRLLVALGERF